MGCIEFPRKKVFFLCPECGEISPEISNINVDQKNVELKCKICSENGYSSEDFYNEENEDQTILSYSCKPKPIEGEIEDKFLLKEFRNETEELKVDKNSSNKIIPEDKLIESIKMIKLKNEQLKKIIQFNNLIIEASERSQNNYLHLKSLKNISSVLKKEKDRDSKDLKFLLTALNYENKASEKAIKKINDFLIEQNAKETIGRQGESLLLNDKEINDDLIKTISQIKFNQLKEINLSGNKITNIEPLCYMSLPFLEYLNLSNNQIIDIKPLSEINSKHFKYLFIQNNQIKDIEIFLDDNFPTFDILRIDNNKIDKKKLEENKIKKEIGENNEEGYSWQMKNLIDLYERKNLILIKKIDDIKKYNIDYKENMEELDITGEKKGDLMLKYIFINIPSNNIIRRLKLMNNNIQDPSILNRIQFDLLEELDLNSNKIKNLKFLKGMKAKNLQILHLEENDFDDLTILYNIKKYFKNIREIYLGQNNFNPEESKFNHLKQSLRRIGIRLDLN